jgi:peptidoglycan hydrolase CwlO-like protein
MKKTKRKTILFTLLASILLILGACGNTNDEAQPVDESENQESTTNENENTEADMDEEMEGMDHSGMNHSGSGEVPEGL